MTSERLARAARLRAGRAGALTFGCADFSRGPAAVAVDAGAGEGGAANPDGAASFAAVEDAPDRRLPALSLDGRGGGRHRLAAHRRGGGRSRHRRPFRRRERARRQPPARQDVRQRTQRGHGLRGRRRPNTRPCCDGFKKEHDHDPRAACVTPRSAARPPSSSRRWPSPPPPARSWRRSGRRRFSSPVRTRSRSARRSRSR